MGASGRAAVRHLLADGFEVVAVDDDDGPGPPAAAATLGVELVVAPDPRTLAALASDVVEVVVSPGVPARHPVFGLGPEVSVIGEVELAWRRARVPVVGITGTNGKTTITTLVAAMLDASGIKAVAAGNIGLPLLDAVEADVSVVVAEVSSFQLALTEAFAPAVAAWCNFTPDHLDWHGTVEAYRAAKARVWANAGPAMVVVANADDPVVEGEARTAAARGARLVTFGRRGDFHVHQGALVTPTGDVVVRLEEMPRTLPHDVANALCAAAAAMAAGATTAGCRDALSAFRGLPHRVELVGEANGVRFYDDSKATTPAATLAALEGFDSVVLIAGGRNKGLDLSVLAGAAHRLRAVVAIGEAASEVAAAFDGSRPVVEAASMGDAVAAAASLAVPGDAVVLSPACASFDWYGSYGERGDDFSRWVRDTVGVASNPGSGR